jgi:hypothetical protein
MEDVIVNRKHENGLFKGYVFKLRPDPPKLEPSPSWRLLLRNEY